jgi:hypothetical protein
MRKLTLPIMLGLMLLPAATAAAKEPVAAKICGPSDCTTVKDRQTLMALIEGGGPRTPPSRGVPWYSMRIAIDTGQERPDHFDQVVVPSRGLVRAEDPEGGFTWFSMSRRAADVAGRLTHGIEAFPASKLKGTGPVEAKVDEVVLPPKPEPAAAADGGGSSPLPWIAGGLVLLGLLALVLVRWRGRPWPRPAQG